MRITSEMHISQEMATAEGIRLGGTKGHVEEVERDAIFILLFHSFRWKMIRNCTGRYTCRDHKAVSHLAPSRLLEAAGLESSEIHQLRQYYVTFDAKVGTDPMYVIPFAETRSTGLISYVKRGEGGDGVSYVHTLNSGSGFRRKLEAMSIALLDACLVTKHDEREKLLGSEMNPGTIDP